MRLIGKVWKWLDQRLKVGESIQETAGTAFRATRQVGFTSSAALRSLSSCFKWLPAFFWR